MNAQRSTRVFKSGNSKAVRLPADYPLELGQEVIVREEAGRFVIEPVRRTIDLSGIYGTKPGLRPRAGQDRNIESRSPDWDGKLLKRG